MFEPRRLLYRSNSRRDPTATEPELAPVDPLERRATPRFVPLEHRSWLARRDSDGFHPVPVRLLDISQGGALVESVRDATTSEEVWFWVDPVRDPSDLVPAWVVGVTEDTRDRHRVHLEFHAPCPEHVLERALWCERRLTPGSCLAAPAASDTSGVIFASPAHDVYTTLAPYASAVSRQ